MPRTPAHPDHREGDHREGDHRQGEFADLFARKARTPLRGFLPGPRVWKAVGGSAAAVLVAAGCAAAVSSIDWGGADKVTTAADEVASERNPSGDAKKPSAVPSSPSASPKKKEEDRDKRAPDVVYLPAPGRDRAEAVPPSPESGSTPDSDDSTTGSQEKQRPSSTDTQPQSETAPLWADGNLDPESIEYWDQSSVTVKTTRPLTELKVVVRIIQTGGVAHTGTWSSLGDKVDVAAAADSTQLAYVVTLKPGITVHPGTYVFQFQYNHDQGSRDAGRDRYNVTATSSDSTTETRTGGF